MLEVTSAIFVGINHDLAWMCEIMSLAYFPAKFPLLFSQDAIPNIIFLTENYGIKIYIRSCQQKCTENLSQNIGSSFKVYHSFNSGLTVSYNYWKAKIRFRFH